VYVRKRRAALGDGTDVVVGPDHALFIADEVTSQVPRMSAGALTSVVGVPTCAGVNDIALISGQHDVEDRYQHQQERKHAHESGEGEAGDKRARVVIAEPLHHADGQRSRPEPLLGVDSPSDPLDGVHRRCALSAPLVARSIIRS
jgi:hypothetical protein